MKKIIFILIIMGFSFTKDTSLSISYSPGILEFEESDDEVDYNTIGIKYSVHSSSSSEWGAFYDLDTEEGEINLLGVFMKSYFQQDVFSPFLEFNVGLALTDNDNYLTVGGRLGGSYEISDKNSIEIAFKYLYFETDYQEYYISSAVLGYSFKL